MGYMKHESVTVVVADYDPGWKSGEIQAAVDELRESLSPRWAALIVGPVEAIVNGDYSYVMLPDGSKEGWGDSNEGDRIRGEFLAIFRERADYPHIAHVAFGDDDPFIVDVDAAVSA